MAKAQQSKQVYKESTGEKWSPHMRKEVTSDIIFSLFDFASALALFLATSKFRQMS